MVQSRLLRKSHIDSYYCAALFRYMKEYAIKYSENINLLFEVDKHTVKVREPSYPVAVSERGESVLVSKSTSFKVADHDFTNTNLFHWPFSIVQFQKMLMKGFIKETCTLV